MNNPICSLANTNAPLINVQGVQSINSWPYQFTCSYFPREITRAHYWSLQL